MTERSNATPGAVLGIMTGDGERTLVCNTTEMASPDQSRDPLICFSTDFRKPSPRVAPCYGCTLILTRKGLPTSSIEIARVSELHADQPMPVPMARRNQAGRIIGRTLSGPLRTRGGCLLFAC
jgi:hypothetical protein